MAAAGLYDPRFEHDARPAAGDPRAGRAERHGAGHADGGDTDRGGVPEPVLVTEAAPATGPSRTPARRQAIHAPAAPSATAPGTPMAATPTVAACQTRKPW